MKLARRRTSSASLDLERRAPADSIASAGSSGSPHPPAADPELLVQRDRLIERFAVMQSELGGLFYEMAIRDHVRMEVLIPKAAELQRVDSELGQVRRMIETGATSVGGNCRACGAVYARGAAFCAQCAEPLVEP
jgi:hypothetical protein